MEAGLSFKIKESENDLRNQMRLVRLVSVGCMQSSLIWMSDQ